MPSKNRKNKPAELPTIPKELIDQFVSGPMSAEAVNAASMAFKKALIERALGAELTHHLALRNITADWGRAAKDWKEAMNQFAILYDDRFTVQR